MFTLFLLFSSIIFGDNAYIDVDNSFDYQINMLNSSVQLCTNNEQLIKVRCIVKGYVCQQNICLNNCMEHLLKNESLVVKKSLLKRINAEKISIVIGNSSNRFAKDQIYDIMQCDESSIEYQFLMKLLQLKRTKHLLSTIDDRLKALNDAQN